MKKHKYEGKLSQLLELEQIERHDNMNDSNVENMKKKIEQRITGHEQKG